MAEGTLASAVILPDQDALVPSPDAGLKRRQSSTTDHDPDSKRRRLSLQSENRDPEAGADRQQSSPGDAEKKPTDRKDTRVAGRRDEERKRGQRLFGSLLGTLSQSPNSTAQRRRADIEKKQQDKLKLQDEEYGELKKKRREERAALRKKEQKLYEKEMMHTRHSNLVATAHFLKTKTEPVLYYKPWQLRSEEEAIIRDQVNEAEATVSRELEEFEARSASQEDKHPEDKKEEKPEEVPVSNTDAPETQEPKQESSETVGAETNHEKTAEAARNESESQVDNNVPGSSHETDVHRGAEDDGGEVVEDQEDTVIY